MFLNRYRKYLYAFIVFISLALRLFALGRSSYWIDEMVSVHFAKSPYWGSIFWDNSPFLYHLILKAWVHWFGDTEVATRFLSVIFSTSTTGLLIYFGNRYFGVIAACAMGVFHGISPFSVYYAQETRMYALFEMFTTLNMIFFYQVWNREHKKIKYGVSLFLLSLTHYLSVVPIVAQVGFFALKEKKAKDSIKPILIIGLTLATTLVSYLKFFSLKHLNWQIVKFEIEPRSHWPTDILWSLFNESWISLIGFIILISFFIWNLRKANLKTLLKGSGFFAPFVILPIVAFTAATLVLNRSMLLPRYLIFTLPYMVSWTGLTLALTVARPHIKIFEKRLLYLSFLMITTGGFIGLKENYLPHKAPWREVAATIGQYTESTVFTTRTESIKTPYFERLGINVEKLENRSQMTEKVKEALAHFRNVWVIETYLAGITYFSTIKSEFEKAGLSTKEFTVKNDYSEPIFVMLIQNPIPKTP